jgi:hypothetical protein
VTRILALITGWIFLTPLLLVVWIGIGGAIPMWLVPIATITYSPALLIGFTLAGVGLIIWFIRKAMQPSDIEPPLGGR